MTTPSAIVRGHEDQSIAAINRLELEADIPEAEASDVRWLQAERVVEALASGLTQQQVADGWHRIDGSAYSQTHVSFTAKTWNHYYYSNNRPRWYDAYNSDEVRKGGRDLTPLMSSDTDEWTTPPHIITTTLKLFGGTIDLDPCSDDERSVPAGTYFTQAADGLAHDWFGTVYMNPPYGKVLPDWTGKLLDEYEHGDVTEAIALVPSRTDTKWFQELRDHPRCFINGRLKFGGAKNSAPFPSTKAASTTSSSSTNQSTTDTKKHTRTP